MWMKPVPLRTEDDISKVPKGWWDDAGAAPSCSSFQGFTFEVEETPDKLPQPMKKRQQLAAKRLELQLQNRQQAPKVPEQDAEVPAAVKPTSKSKVNSKSKAKSKSKVKSKKDKPKGEKPTRKPADGPMAATMKAFLKSTKQKNEGIKHVDALKLWMDSEERNKIVEAIPTPERKRRRFEK